MCVCVIRIGHVYFSFKSIMNLKAKTRSSTQPRTLVLFSYVYLEGSFHTLQNGREQSPADLDREPRASLFRTELASPRADGGGRGARWGGGALSHAAEHPPRRGGPRGLHRAFSLLARWRRRQQVSKALNPPPPTVSHTIPEKEPHRGLITHPDGKHRGAGYRRESALGLAFPDVPRAPTTRLLSFLRWRGWGRDGNVFSSGV